MRQRTDRDPVQADVARLAVGALRGRVRRVVQTILGDEELAGGKDDDATNIRRIMISLHTTKGMQVYVVLGVESFMDHSRSGSGSDERSPHPILLPVDIERRLPDELVKPTRVPKPALEPADHLVGLVQRKHAVAHAVGGKADGGGKVGGAVQLRGAEQLWRGAGLNPVGREGNQAQGERQQERGAERITPSACDNPQRM